MERVKILKVCPFSYLSIESKLKDVDGQGLYLPKETDRLSLSFNLFQIWLAE